MPDWNELFGLSVSPWELVVRGSAVYWFLVIIFRFQRRDVGSIGMADILLLVIVADAAQNAMAGEYRSITDGFILILTIIGWNFLIDWSTFRFPAIRKILDPKELCLVRNGQFMRRNMRREMIAEEDLLSKLRENGVADVKEVEAAYIERDGAISVIKKKRSG